ncbi:MAG: VWA domain-containing protein [Trueperaceae bacterium]
MNLAFLAPQFLWALLALPLVVLLHFLRTRRRPRVVSALFLWRRARQAAESRRRFSPTWLLILQLLFAALAALALARPTISLAGPPDRVLVIDASASMRATDGDGVRLDKARAAAAEFLGGSGRVALIRAGLEASVVAPLVTDRTELRRALATLEAGDHDADLLRAVDLARALAPNGEVHLFSDSPAPSGSPFAYHPVGGDAINYGITTFDIGIRQAYVAVTSNDPRPQQLDLALWRGDRVLASTTLLVPAEGQANVTFPLDAAPGLLEARLVVPQSDGLALDDVAFAGQRSLTVVMEGESQSLLRALSAIPDTEVRVARGSLATNADVRVMFGPLAGDGQLPTGNILSFALPAEEPVYRAIRDWDQGDELLRFVDLRETIVGLAPDVTADQEVEQQEGWEILARTGDLTPVLSRFSSPGTSIIRVAFHPSQTDMVLRPAFPALIANIMSSFHGQASLPLGATLPEDATLDGRPVEYALIPAVYQTPSGPLAASLLSAAETRLTPASAPVPESRPAATSPLLVDGSRGLGVLLVLIACLVLLIEWIGWSRGGAGWLRGN